MINIHERHIENTECTALSQTGGYSATQVEKQQ